MSVTTSTCAIPLQDDIDARRWAREFVQMHPDADEGVMLGWFANAIEAGRRHALDRSTASSETA